MPYLNFVVDSDYSLNERLDKYISTVSPKMNRSKLKSGATEVTVNGKNQKISYKVKPNDRISVLWEDNVPADIPAENIPLDIIYEDENVCVVNKPQGMVTHPALGNWQGTLVNALLFHWGREDIHQDFDQSERELLKNRRPGIVHRLDKDTSGIIITAKNRDTEEFLGAQFRSHRGMKKEYICICFGRPQHTQGVIRTQIIRDPKDRKRFRADVNTNEGKYSESVYKCIACYGEYSLMKVRIKTGRTHQIRVHMKYLNCPILGDSIYYKKDRIFPDATLMLHSRLLKIKIPGKDEYCTFRTKTPERFLSVLKKLHSIYPKTILPSDR